MTDREKSEGVSDTEERPRLDAHGIEIYRLAFEEGKRRLDFQRDEVDLVRSRAFQVLGLSIAGTSFLAQAVLRRTEVERTPWFYALAGLATVLFALVLVCGFVLMRPIQEWRLAASPWKLVRDHGDLPPEGASEANGEADVAETYRTLAYYSESAHNSNKPILADLKEQFFRFSLLSGGLLVAWVSVAWLFA